MSSKIPKFTNYKLNEVVIACLQLSLVSRLALALPFVKPISSVQRVRLEFVSVLWDITLTLQRLLALNCS